jgi:TPR repeat protein
MEPVEDHVLYKAITIVADEETAALVELYKDGAKKGHARAIGQLGYSTCFGLGLLPKDTKAGIALIQKAADMGDVFALYKLGIWHIYGFNGLDQDVRHGCSLLKKIRENKTALAQHYDYSLVIPLKCHMKCIT